MTSKKTEESELRKRVWACVIYPESLPADWVDRLKMSGLKAAVSPLHDRDYNPDGTPKKAHYHLILVYGNTTTFNNVSKFTMQTLCGTIPISLESVIGMYRYFTHEENPEKAQYNKSDIQLFNGFNINDFVKLTAEEIQKIKKELQKLILKKNILEYCDLMDYLLIEGDDYYYNIASNNTIFFTKYIASRRNSITSRKLSREMQKTLKEHNENDNNN